MSRISNQEWERRKSIADQFAAHVDKPAAAPVDIAAMKERLNAIGAMLQDPDVTMRMSERQDIAIELWDLKLAINELEAPQT